MKARILLTVLGALFTLNAVAQLARQKDASSGVTVAVTPGDLGGNAKTWDFSVVLDTHSQELSDDLAKSAVLVDDKGNQYKAIAWDGAGPGGHHRKGVVKFKPIAPKPQAIELRISRAGEPAPRSFRWQLR